MEIAQVKVVEFEKLKDLPAPADLRVRILKAFLHGANALHLRQIVDAPVEVAARWITEGLAARYISDADEKASQRQPVIQVLKVVGVSTEQLIEKVVQASCEMPEERGEIGEHCRALREYCNLSRKEISNLLRTSAEAVAAWEEGEAEPDPGQWLLLQALVKFGGVMKAWAKPGEPPPPVNRIQHDSTKSRQSQQGDSHAERGRAKTSQREEQALSLAGQVESRVNLLKTVLRGGKQLAPGTVVVIPTAKAQAWILKGTAEAIGLGVSNG